MFQYLNVASKSILKEFQMGSCRDLDSLDSDNLIIFENHQRLKILEERYNLDDLFVFAFVRNPYDRVKSWFSYHTGHCYDNLTFEEWVNNGCKTHFNIQNKTNWINEGLSPLLQYNFIVSSKKKVDFVGKIENYENDMKIITEKLNNICKEKGIQHEFIFRNVKCNTNSQNKNKKNLEMSNETKEKIYNLFKKDFEYFGYDKQCEIINNLDNSIKVKNKKNILVLNHNYHHKNKKGLEMICEYLNYNLIYGSEKDIPDADVIYCPSKPFNVRKYPNKRFIFGPHLSIFPDNKLRSIQNLNNCVYIQPSPWARDVWINWKDIDVEKLIPIKSFPFPVEVDLFKPDEDEIKENVFVMFKHRKPEELRFVENFLNNKKISYKTFRYGSYKQDDYINHLKTCKYGIWIGRHESQGFALHESLSCNVPLLVWNVTNMRQQHGWNGCPDVYGTTIPFWDTTCGEYFYKEDEFEETYNKILENLDSYNPREFILNTVSVKQCAENFKKLFLNNDEKNTYEKDNDDIIFMTLTNDGYLDYTLNCIESLKMCNSKYQLNCYCIGNECVQRLSNNNIKTIKINNNDNFSFQSYGGKNWSNIVIEKIKSIHDNLYKYKYICYTDGDIVFLNNKFMDYCIENIGESDMICQNDCDKYGCDCIRWICSGFMFIKSSETTRNFFNLKNIQLNDNWRDQKWINANKHKIKYKLLPKDLFPNGGYYYKNIDKISDPYMIHFNFVVGHEKKNRMKEYNKWFLNS